MLKYIVIQLSDSSVSYCHYSSGGEETLISLENLEAGLIWAVKNGLSIQILYPQREIPNEYNQLISGYEHVEIRPLNQNCGDISVVSSWSELQKVSTHCERPLILHTSIEDFLCNYNLLITKMSFAPRFNVVFSDVWNFNDNIHEAYKKVLLAMSDEIIRLYKHGTAVQVNLLTDRIMLTEMNNCNAGVENITLAPDGQFYICPAFCCDNSSSVGNPSLGFNIPNRQLYKLDFAPICRACDAFHCHRCVWLNRKMTNEVNTPGHEQCVMAHIEREASRKLLDRLRDFIDFQCITTIPELTYNDPFDKIINHL